MWQVIYTRIVTSEKMQELKKKSKAGAKATSGGGSIGASGFGFGGSVSGEVKNAVSTAFASADESKQSSSMGSSTIVVMGGIPVGDASTLEGFAAWADTVTKNPMPVKYKLGSFLELATPIITAWTSDQDDKVVKYLDAGSTSTPKVGAEISPCEPPQPPTCSSCASCLMRPA